MAIQIEVHDTHIQPLINFYLERLKALRAEIIEREQEVREINSTIQKLKKRNVTASDTDKNTPITNYSEKWPWVKKVQFAIEFKGTPLTTKEIVDTLSEFESSFLIDRKRVVASISSILSSKSGEGKDFTRVDSESGDFAYALNTPNNTTALSNDDDDDSLPF